MAVLFDPNLRGLVPTTLEETSHDDIFRQFARGPGDFVARVLGDGDADD